MPRPPGATPPYRAARCPAAGVWPPRHRAGVAAVSRSFPLRSVACHHAVILARATHPPCHGELRPSTKIIGAVIVIRVAPMCGFAALGRHVMKKTAILEGHRQIAVPRIPPLHLHRHMALDPHLAGLGIGQPRAVAHPDRAARHGNLAPIRLGHLAREAPPTLEILQSPWPHAPPSPPPCRAVP